MTNLVRFCRRYRCHGPIPPRVALVPPLPRRNADIRFSFLTGVSKFSKVSLFSGLNNLIDITLEPAF